MADHRPFRFGVYAGGPPDAWAEHVQRAEALGYDTLAIGEHIFTDLAPISAMAAAAMLTSRIRIASHAFGNDFRNPVMLAKEVASLDVVSGGRVELGFGSGYLRMDYDQTGIPFDPPGERLSRYFEAVRLIKAAFTEDTVDFDGEHYTTKGLSLVPKPVQRPYPPLLIGGGGRRVLQFAAREADIVGINIKSTRDGWFDWESIGPEATAQKVAWVRDAAGDRFPHIELHWLAMRFAITDHPEAAARELIDDFGMADAMSVEAVLDSPHMFIGSEDAITEKIRRCREEYGVSYMTVFAGAMEPFAPIVARLAGT